MICKINKLLAVFIFTVGILPAIQAESKRKRYPTNEIAVDFPIDGGAMLMATRFWPVGRHLQFGLTAGGGVIQRDFTLEVSGQDDLDGTTEAVVFPFVGPRLTFFYKVIGLSLAYGAFYAKTDFEASGQNVGTATGETKDWGSGIYAPLLVLDFYHEKANMVFGIGLGGFIGTSYPDLVANSPTAQVRSNRNPLSTLTFHVRTLWSTKRGKGGHPMADDFDDDFDDDEF